MKRKERKAEDGNRSQAGNEGDVGVWRSKCFQLLVI